MSNTLSDEKLSELAYALQINYDPSNINRDDILAKIFDLKEKAKLLVNNKSEWEKEIRENRLASRKSTPCHQKSTVISHKDTELMSNDQIVFLPEIDPITNKRYYYCLDRAEDVDYVMKSGVNPFTNQLLTEEQKEYLLSQTSLYPNIIVGDYFDEIENRLLDTDTKYEEKEYLRLIEELANLIRHATGLDYLVNSVYYFGTIVKSNQYNMFLTDGSLYTSVSELAPRDIAAATTLQYILDYINSHEVKNNAILQMGKAIDEFVYGIKNNLNYDQLVEEYGEPQIGVVKELYWKPFYVKETYYDTGELQSRYYVDEYDMKSGIYRTWSKNGQLIEQGIYQDDKQEGVWVYCWGNGNQSERITYLHDVMEGPYQRWNLDGSPHEEGEFKMDQKNGIWKRWNAEGDFTIEEYQDGILLSETPHKGNKPHGLHSAWYSSGLLKESRYYDNGKRTGIWEEFYPNQQIKSKGRYINDKKEGIWEEWYENGDQKSRILYKDGKRRRLL